MEKLFFSLLMLTVMGSYECCTITDTYVDISVQNTKGADLLNPDTPGVFQKPAIKIFYAKNGEAGFPVGFSISQRKSGYAIRIYASETKGKSDICIQWDETDTDTLTCQIKRKGPSALCRKLWLNGLLKWPLSGNQAERHIVIVKNRPKAET